MKNDKIKEAAEFYLENDCKISLTKVGEQFGVRRQSISEYLKKHGHEVVNYQNLPRINENVFNEIDTEEKAYWLGFICADGCIYNNEKRFGMNLAIKDKGHMEKFAKFLEFTGVIGEGKSFGFNSSSEKQFDMCRISFRNANIWNQLNNKGCTPRKSLTLKFPDKSVFKSEDLIKHFMRGYVDGDGGLCLFNVKGFKRAGFYVLGTQEFLEVFADYINIDRKHIRSKSHGDVENKAFTISQTHKAARKCAHFLYKDCNIYLDRKYEKYLEICRLEGELFRSSSNKNGES